MHDRALGAFGAARDRNSTRLVCICALLWRMRVFALTSGDTRSQVWTKHACDCCDVGTRTMVVATRTL